MSGTCRCISRIGNIWQIFLVRRSGFRIKTVPGILSCRPWLNDYTHNELFYSFHLSSVCQVITCRPYRWCCRSALQATSSAFTICCSVWSSQIRHISTEGIESKESLYFHRFVQNTKFDETTSVLLSGSVVKLTSRMRTVISSISLWRKPMLTEHSCELSLTSWQRHE